MRRHRAFTFAAVLTAGALAFSACSSGSPSGEGEPAPSEGANAGELTPITVGVLSIAPAAAIQYGIDEGIFEEHGLDVKTQVAQGGAAMLPAVSTGQIDFGVGNPLSVLVAASQSVDVRIVTGYSFSLAEGDDINAVVARAGDGIESWADLAGKTVSVNAVNTQGDLTIKESVAKAGGDPDSVKFIEIAFPDALAQLDSGNVDAVWIPEPFMAQAGANPDKYVTVGFPNQESIPGMATMVTFASGAVAEDAELLKTWRAALGDVLDAATADREGFGEAISSFTGMPAEVAGSLRLERLTADLDAGLITDLSELAVKYEFIASEPDLDTVIVK